MAFLKVQFGYNQNKSQQYDRLKKKKQFVSFRTKFLTELTVRGRGGVPTYRIDHRGDEGEDRLHVEVEYWAGRAANKEFHEFGNKVWLWVKVAGHP